MVLLIDNYDSFVHNLARYFRLLHQETEVIRNDAATTAEIAALAPDFIVISPGPCTPREAGMSVDVVRQLGPRIPVLGICLGHQCIAAAFGGRVVAADRPTHGRASPIHHAGNGLFSGLPSPFPGGRYHSLAVANEPFPVALRIEATGPAGEIMALSHRRLPIWGVQFHPESILTSHGLELLKNFLNLKPVEHGAVE